MSVGLVADYFPALYERMAVRLQPYRFRLMATGAVTWALLFAAMLWAARFHPVFSSASGPYLKVAFGAAWVVITTSSGLFLCAYWFHPSSGVLRQRPTDTAVIRALRTAGRLWASFVLSLMFLVIPAPLAWCF
jgi:hypothetical protein